MIVSAYRTKLTQMIHDGVKNPERSPVNRVATERHIRRDLWLAKKAKENAKP